MVKTTKSKNIKDLCRSWQFWAIVGGVALVIIVTMVIALTSKSSDGQSSGSSSNTVATCETGKVYYMPDGRYKIPDDFPAGTYQITAPGTDNSFGLNGYRTEKDIDDYKYEQYFSSSSKNNGTDKNLITLRSGLIYVARDTDGQLQMLCDPANVNSNASSNSSQPSNDSSSTSSASNSNWKQWLKDYEAWVDKYIAAYKKYQSNPTDASLISEYTKLAAEASEWATKANSLQGDLSASDAAEFAKTYARIAEKLSKM